LDPDPHRSALILAGWIRISIGRAESGRAKRPSKIEKVKKFLVVKCCMFSVEGCRLLL
jgi:hypothetical protein